MFRPIIFNSEMVKAILDGRKTQTRRLVKPQPVFEEGEHGIPVRCDDESFVFQIMPYECIYEQGRIPPCLSGDVIWVRETWRYVKLKHPTGKAIPVEFKPYEYNYRADGDIFDQDGSPVKWKPAIHMPKEAARIFLKVKGVRMEQLQGISAADIRAEGLSSMCAFVGDMEIALPEWRNLWNSTLKKADLEKYGWDANPWVWVIEFERCDEPKGWYTR